MATLKSAFEKVKGLVSDFKANELYYLSSEYSEPQVRLDYINKFFEALGWDVRHKIQKNPYEQEVKVEKGVKVGRAQKRADYAFYLAPNFRDPVFFVEAKKPARSLSNPDDYFQAIRYGWNANTPIVILTDFEEFHIIDSRFKPDINTTLNKKLKYFHYSEYADREKFAEIYYLFSHEAVGNNSIEKYAESLPKPKGKAVQWQLFPGGFQSIDESFLEEIDGIRITLASAFKKSNTTLQGYELTEAIQRTIDRIVFIRFLEDKLIEQEHYISELGENSDTWDDFVALCKRLDVKYNGVVFKHHFIDSPGFNKPKDVFGNICEDLSHLNSPYDFDKIPIHILGSIYERFLGKVVHATHKTVTIEDKPEVKKAGGVYYTPQYIVRYIVANTVGKLIEGRTPLQISRLRFADIACGSGSFLIGVFETLLDYHNNWYQNNPAKAKSDGCFHQDGKWVLSLQQKKNILLNNIYGVDIDSQAVEVTQLSLCLKLMEDETTATANEMQVLFHQQILPDLTKNIVCGNSLIGTDILYSTLFSNEEERKLNPMEFGNVFPEIMDNGGFDAIVGNPPYVKARDYDGEKNIYRNYLNKSPEFETLYSMWDLYIPFLERGTKILKKNGMLGFIIPDTLEKADYAKLIRKYIIKNYFVPQIDFYPDSYIFKSDNQIIGIKNIILFMANFKGKTTKKMIHSKDYREINSIKYFKYDIDIFSTYNLEINLERKNTQKLSDICLVSYGLRLNSDKNDKTFHFRKSDLVSNVKSKRYWKQYTEGKYLSRYQINQVRYLEWESERCPKRLVRPTFPELYETEKILLGRQTRVGAFDDQNTIVDNTIIICALHNSYKGIANSNLKKYYGNLKFNRKDLIEISRGYDIKFLLGVINSSTTKYFLKIQTKGGD